MLKIPKLKTYLLICELETSGFFVDIPTLFTAEPFAASWTYVFIVKPANRTKISSWVDTWLNTHRHIVRNSIVDSDTLHRNTSSIIILSSVLRWCSFFLRTGVFLDFLFFLVNKGLSRSSFISVSKLMSPLMTFCCFLAFLGTNSSSRLKAPSSLKAISSLSKLYILLAAIKLSSSKASSLCWCTKALVSSSTYRIAALSFLTLSEDRAIMNFRFNKTLKETRTDENDILENNPIFKSYQKNEKFGLRQSFYKKDSAMASASLGQWRLLVLFGMTVAIYGLYRTLTTGDTVMKAERHSFDVKMLEEEGKILEGKLE